MNVVDSVNIPIAQEDIDMNHAKIRELHNDILKHIDDIRGHLGRANKTCSTGIHRTWLYLFSCAYQMPKYIQVTEP